jgi:hypothetical protein
MAKVFCLYLDDSGTRNPNHDPPEYQYRDWFGLGGILLKEEDESKARKLHADFCSQWSITYPLRSFGIRNRTGKFSWLERLDVATYNRFIDSITKLALSIPALGHACAHRQRSNSILLRRAFGRGDALRDRHFRKVRAS